MLIVDGDNWIFSEDPGGVGEAAPLERRRNQAIRLLLGWSDWHDEAVLVVFDGVEDRSRQRMGAVEVQYTGGGRKADDDIIDYVERLARPAEARVVTGDRAVADAVRAAGVEVWSPHRFAQQLAELRSNATRKMSREDLEKPGFEADVDGMVSEFEQAPPPPLEPNVRRLRRDDTPAG